MNGLTLRVSGGGVKKVKNASIGVAAVPFPNELQKTFENNTLYEPFLASTTADEQLVKLKVILDDYKEAPYADIMLFLVLIFLQAPPKHPVKCFLTKQITKNKHLEKPFPKTLATELEALMLKSVTDYVQYYDVILKLFTCLENFPAGIEAIKTVEVTTMEYLKKALACCVETLKTNKDKYRGRCLLEFHPNVSLARVASFLRGPSIFTVERRTFSIDIKLNFYFYILFRNPKTLSPTEKNEIFNLAHLTLKLILHIVQRITYSATLKSKFENIRSSTSYLIFDEDVPMDTKSLSGILLLSMYVLENGENSWIHILQSQQPDDLKQFLKCEASHLSLYSSIAIVVPSEKLQSETINGTPALVVLIRKILSIGERSSSDATFTLGVTRTVLLIAKCLDKIHNRQLGLAIVDSILVFVWSHLEHYMDSVRHLTAQSLACIVKYCCKLRNGGDDTALSSLFQALTSLDTNRKSYYVSLTSLCNELGAVYVLERVDGLIVRTIAALSVQAVQASATTTLETLLRKHVRETDSKDIYLQWVRPLLTYVATKNLDCGVLNILENLLAKVVKQNEDIMQYILPHIKEPTSTHASIDDGNLKCVLMLLSVARKSGVTNNYAKDENEGLWKGMISYEVLKTAAVDSVDETRILSLSLVVESLKSTEIFTAGDFECILYFMKYNINTQSPNFRQLILSFMKKFMKRLEESYKVLKRQKEPNLDKNKGCYYLEYFEELRRFCFDSLLQGANYSRKFLALQTLVWCEQLNLEDYSRIWKEEYIEKLLLHLEDSYESNKAFALEILCKCPTELLEAKKYSISLQLKDILQQASYVKPTECVSAAFKLKLLNKKLPHLVLKGQDCEVPNASTYFLIQTLLNKLQDELSVAQTSILTAASQGPMYGLLHCMCYLIKDLNADKISTSQSWSVLISQMIETSLSVNEAVAGIVNNSSPEGHLPMDREGVLEMGGVKLDDGSQVTAQMVLLCAWRSVKEVSLILGEISSRLSVEGEASPSGTLSHDQLLRIGRHFTSLLSETKHRGAFEQAYVGFTLLLTRLWRCRSSLHLVPARWLGSLATPEALGSGALCATRRSAGLPFIVQALVTTELQVNGNPKCFHECMNNLLNMAQYDPAEKYTAAQVESRTHALNILRALFRNTVLCERAGAYAGRGLKVAIRGFDAGTWPERNSSTLLFSALMVRIFGVQRTKDTDQLCVRNKMTGRIFFLRYPDLYDFMLDKLKEVNISSDAQLLKPSLYPILLLLARLYPSSLEGTVSNLKLVAFIPYVLSCSRSCVLKTRQLAAKAMVPLVSPERYVDHLKEMFIIMCDESVSRNYCHGVLLQLIRVLDAKPDNMAIEPDSMNNISQYIKRTFWILEQSLGNVPCYLITDEYIKVINLIILRFPTLIDKEMLLNFESSLEKLLFNEKSTLINSGKDICLANALYLHCIISNEIGNEDIISPMIYRSLSHTSYEVVLSTLNYLLILYDRSEEENHCKFQNHITEKKSKITLLNYLRNDKEYHKKLCHVLNSKVYLECTQKALKVLSLEKHTQRLIINLKDTEMTDNDVILKLINRIENEHENLTHIYLYSLLNLVTEKLKENELNIPLVEVLRLLYNNCSSENNDNTRQVAVEFLEINAEHLFDISLVSFSEQDKFEYKTTLLSTIVTLLEDDNYVIRQKISNVVCNMSHKYRWAHDSVIPSRAAEILRDIINVYIGGGAEKIAIYLVLALLDFKSEVCLSDYSNDECRVFDQNERYNIFLEETIWTYQCADIINAICSNTIKLNARKYIPQILNNNVYRNIIEKLCNSNFRIFEEILHRSSSFKGIKNDALNPKIELFVNKLL